MTVPAADLEVGTLAGDDALLERLLFEVKKVIVGSEVFTRCKELRWCT